MEFNYRIIIFVKKVPGNKAFCNCEKTFHYNDPPFCTGNWPSYSGSQ